MTRRALSLHSNTGPRVILSPIARHGVDRIWVFTFVVFLFFRNIHNHLIIRFFLIEYVWVGPLVDEILKIDLFESRKAGPTPVHEKSILQFYFAWATNCQNATFCVDLSFPSTSVYFSGPAGGRSLRARVPSL